MDTRKNFCFTLFVCAILAGLLSIPSAAAGLEPGDKAPTFNLKDTHGAPYALAIAKGRQMTVLYFFDAGSRSNQEGLLMLDSLLKRYPDEQLSIWGITRSSRSEAQAFSQNAKLGFPILMDTQDIGRRYGAGPVLPVVCTLGPDLTVLDYFQGGGKSAEIMLVRLAERQLNRDRPQLAQAIGAEVAKKNPASSDALAVQGYAALKQGKVGEAESVFKKIAAKPGKDAYVGIEGQAAVKARRGKTSEAMALAEKVIQHAPERDYAEKLKGDLLAGQGDTRGAQNAYERAAGKPEAAPFQQAEAHNQLGRLYASQGDYRHARDFYDQAIQLDPYYLEPTSNKGVTFEKEGMWTKALGEYRRALALDQNDMVAAVLARKAEQLAARQKDAGRQERIRQLVKDLAERFKNSDANTAAGAAAGGEDMWTSRPMIVTFLDMKESGGIAARDGLAMALSTRLGEMLQKSGRVQVVERALMEQLLSELNLGSSDLADPATALKLGRVLAAKLIGTGTLMHLSGSTMISLRLIDTETSAVAKTVNRRVALNQSLDSELYQLNRDILKAVMEKYPLQGYVIESQPEEVMLNLGNSQGVVAGTAFDVIEGGKSIQYKGRTLQRAGKTIGRLEVTRVEPDLCFARVVHQQRPLKTDDQIKEVLTDAVIKRKN
jgi:tetratricopeptide (TPR) repeat protein/peroxiredoxin